MFYLPIVVAKAGIAASAEAAAALLPALVAAALLTALLTALVAAALLLLLRAVCVVALLLLLGGVFGFFGGFRRLKLVGHNLVSFISFYFYVCCKNRRFS